MIRYTLCCADGHEFDVWFQSSGAFDALQARDMVACAVCGTTEVRKSLMTPQVGGQDATVAPSKAAVPHAMAAGPLSAPGSKMEAMLRELRRTVEENSTYVGRGFADEARKMHLGETPERQIHGEATSAEAKALLEDGVPVLPLPGVAKSKTN
ncbi:MAG: DUF1178 family protein [Pseudomonadota bacterium]